MATVISKRQALGQIAAFVAIPAAIIGGIIALQSAPTSTSSAPAISAPPLSCKTDWTVCTDNSDMANNYSGWSSAKIDCKFAANDQAKYGTPKWPSWGSEFGSFRRGDDYKSGKVTLIEPDAQFSNGFGAMVHVRATCQYDLREKRVLSVNLVAAR